MGEERVEHNMSIRIRDQLKQNRKIKGVLTVIIVLLERFGVTLTANHKR